eukprot:764811-Hanusia_phi.AAC.3
MTSIYRHYVLEDVDEQVETNFRISPSRSQEFLDALLEIFCRLQEKVSCQTHEKKRRIPLPFPFCLPPPPCPTC